MPSLMRRKLEAGVLELRLNRPDRMNAHDLPLVGALVLAVHEFEKPVIAAVNGPAVGGGLALALAADIRLASTEERFGDVGIRTGLSACDVGMSYLLPRSSWPAASRSTPSTGSFEEAIEAFREARKPRWKPL